MIAGCSFITHRVEGYASLAYQTKSKAYIIPISDVTTQTRLPLYRQHILSVLQKKDQETMCSVYLPMAAHEVSIDDVPLAPLRKLLRGASSGRSYRYADAEMGGRVDGFC
jgi:hypothetical protein